MIRSSPRPHSNTDSEKTTSSPAGGPGAAARLRPGRGRPTGRPAGWVLALRARRGGVGRGVQVQLGPRVGGDSRPWARPPCGPGPVNGRRQPREEVRGATLAAPGPEPAARWHRDG
jgi:hypothetical protein